MVLWGILVAGLSLSFSCFFTSRLIIFLGQRKIYDIPNERSSHSRPIPRGGGIAILFGMLLSVGLIRLFLPSIPLPGPMFFISLFLLFMIGFLDDKFTIAPGIRIGVHLVAVGLVIYETGGFTNFPLPEPFSFPLLWVSVPLTIFWVLAVMNIYNFLDGIDGFSGAQAFVAGLAVAILDFGGAGMIIGVSVAFSSLGFLFFNWHPARVFMGDVGSVTLGFIFATIPLYVSFATTYIAHFSIIILLWFFLSDGAFTILERLLKGKKIWQPHREHLYQRWVIKGKKQDKVVLEVMTYSLFLIAGFLFLYHFLPDLLILAFPVALAMYFLYRYRVRVY